MFILTDLGQTLWLLARTAWRFGCPLETPLMVEVGAFPGLAYHVIVATWMEFARVGQVELWERRAFELFGLLSEYSMAIDRFVDTVEGGRRVLANPTLLKHHPDLARYTEALARRMREKHLPRPVCRELLRTIQTYRYAARASLLHALHTGPLADLETVLAHKEATSGAAFGTCVDILSIAHELPPNKRAALRLVFAAWGMALQVTDDLRDLSADYGSVQNIVASALLIRPKERAQLEADGMRSHRLPVLAPETYAHVKSLFDGYLAQAQASGLAGRPLTQILAAARTLLWQGTRHKTAGLFHGYVTAVLRALGSHNRTRHHYRLSLPESERSLNSPPRKHTL